MVVVERRMVVWSLNVGGKDLWPMATGTGFRRSKFLYLYPYSWKNLPKTCGLPVPMQYTRVYGQQRILYEIFKRVNFTLVTTTTVNNHRAIALRGLCITPWMLWQCVNGLPWAINDNIVIGYSGCQLQSVNEPRAIIYNIFIGCVSEAIQWAETLPHSFTVPGVSFIYFGSPSSVLLEYRCFPSYSKEQYNICYFFYASGLLQDLFKACFHITYQLC